MTALHVGRISFPLRTDAVDIAATQLPYMSHSSHKSRHSCFCHWVSDPSCRVVLTSGVFDIHWLQQGLVTSEYQSHAYHLAYTYKAIHTSSRNATFDDEANCNIVDVFRFETSENFIKCILLSMNHVHCYLWPIECCVSLTAWVVDDVNSLQRSRLFVKHLFLDDRVQILLLCRNDDSLN